MRYALVKVIYEESAGRFAQTSERARGPGRTAFNRRKHWSRTGLAEPRTLDGEITVEEKRRWDVKRSEVSRDSVCQAWERLLKPAC